MEKQKTYLNWSSGKDAAMALYQLQESEDYEVARLLTSISKHYDRVSMHGLSREILEAQVRAIGLEVQLVELPEKPSMQDYETIMKASVAQLKAEGFECSAFGDIFLEDLRAYRETQLSRLGMQAIFPLWKRDTKELLADFVDLGFKAIVVSAKASCFGEEFVGSLLDREFLAKIPEGVDPCGENGEFHTFCFDGPIFRHPVAFEVGAKSYHTYDNPESGKDPIGFWYCDLKKNKDGGGF